MNKFILQILIFILIGIISIFMIHCAGDRGPAGENAVGVDLTTPLIVFLTPTAGDTLPNRITVKARALDKLGFEGIEKLIFYLDGENHHDDLSFLGTPDAVKQIFTFTFDFTSMRTSWGPHILDARAYSIDEKIGQATPIIIYYFGGKTAPGTSETLRYYNALNPDNLDYWTFYQNHGVSYVDQMEVIGSYIQGEDYIDEEIFSEDFESGGFTDGGWSFLVGNAEVIQNSQTYQESHSVHGNSAYGLLFKPLPDSINVYYERLSFSLAIRVEHTNRHHIGFAILNSDTVEIASVNMHSNNHWAIWNGNNYNYLSTFLENTWYRIKFELDLAQSKYNFYMNDNLASGDLNFHNPAPVAGISFAVSDENLPYYSSYNVRFSPTGPCELNNCRFYLKGNDNGAEHFTYDADILLELFKTSSGHPGATVVDSDTIKKAQLVIDGWNERNFGNRKPKMNLGEDFHLQLSVITPGIISTSMAIAIQKLTLYDDASNNHTGFYYTSPDSQRWLTFQQGGELLAQDFVYNPAITLEFILETNVTYIQP